MLKETLNLKTVQMVSTTSLADEVATNQQQQTVEKNTLAKIKGILTSQVRTRKSSDTPYYAFFRSDDNSKHSRAECERTKCKSCEIPIIQGGIIYTFFNKDQGGEEAMEIPDNCTLIIDTTKGEFRVKGKRKRKEYEVKIKPPRQTVTQEIDQEALENEVEGEQLETYEEENKEEIFKELKEKEQEPEPEKETETETEKEQEQETEQETEQEKETETEKEQETEKEKEKEQEKEDEQEEEKQEYEEENEDEGEG